jgi:hypothetical protein
MTRAKILTLGAVLALTGCASWFTGKETSDRSPDPQEVALQLERDIRVQASYSLVSQAGYQWLRATILATNEGDRPFVGYDGGLTWWLSAYRTVERNDTPVWTMDEYMADVGMVAISNRVEIAPGDTVVFGERHIPLLPVQSIVGDNPPGVYYFTAELRLIEPPVSHVFAAGQVELPGSSSSR